MIKTVSGMQHVATLPPEAGRITAIKVTEDGIVCSTESGVDYTIRRAPTALPAPKTCTTEPESI